MKKTRFVFLFVFLFAFLSFANYSRAQTIEDVFGGEYILCPVNSPLNVSSNGYFIFSETPNGPNLSFSWINSKISDRQDILFMTVPLSSVRIRIDENAREPKVKFRQIYHKTTVGNRTMGKLTEQNIQYVLIICNSKDSFATIPIESR